MTTTARRWGSATVAAAALLVSACGTPPEPAPAEQPPAAGQPPAPEQQAAPGQPQVASITVEIANGQVQGPTERIELTRGQQVRLAVRSDKADELHVHGYDASAGLVPGEPSTVEFTADIPGVFEVELHESGLVLPSLVVR